MTTNQKTAHIETSIFLSPGRLTCEMVMTVMPRACAVRYKYSSTSTLVAFVHSSRTPNLGRWKKSRAWELQNTSAHCKAIRGPES